MNDLTPKTAFQSDEELTRKWRAIVDNSTFQHGLMMSMAEYSLKWNPSAEELSGARKFIEVVLNLAEVDTPQPKMPVRRVSVISDTRGATPPKPTQRAD